MCSKRTFHCYQANNTVLSPIHLDIISETVSPEDYLNAIGLVMKKFGPPPFGTLLSANANPSTLENWGDDSWVTLVPDADLVSPNKTPVLRGYEGWAYCARTPDKEIFLLYFEKVCPGSQVRGARLSSAYRAQWFDPRNGTWQDTGNGTVRSSRIGIIN